MPEVDAAQLEGEAMLSDRIADLVEYLVAKVIGRRGRTIKAIRTLARALAARLDTAVEVEVLG